MKKIIFLIAFLGLFSMAFAQNPTVGQNAKFNATVINPLVFTDISQQVIVPLDVIKGQTRTFTTVPLVKLFEMSKQEGEQAILWIQCDDVIGGVKLTADWFWYDEMPPWSGGLGVNINPATGWYWNDTAPTQLTNAGWIGLHISKIDATAATTVGPRTFKAKIWGHYTTL